MFIRSVIKSNPKLRSCSPPLEVDALVDIQFEAAVRIDVHVEQRRQPAHVFRRQSISLGRVIQDLLHDARVDIDKRGVDEQERQRRNLLVPDPIGCDLATFAEVHEAVRAVPVLDHVEDFVDLAAEALHPEIAAEEDFPTEGPIIVGMDGGYARARERDGEDSIRSMAEFLSPCAEHVLDWCHVTMRITVLRQYVKGLAVYRYNREEAEGIDRALRRIKGFLWHSNIRSAISCIDDLVADPECIETRYPNIKAFRKGDCELQTYIANDSHTIPNYAERHRYGERVSTAFVESTVNTVVGKRFSKKQQMRWSRSGAHLMLQTRTRVLDGTLRTRFRSWYPGLFYAANTDQEIEVAA